MGIIHAAVEAMDIAESWIEEAYRSMRADRQAMYECSRGMIAEQLVGAAAARISFLLHELDKKGVEKALENDGKRGLHLVSPFYELPCDEYERSGMRFVSYLPDFDGEDPEKGGMIFVCGHAEERCPDTAVARRPAKKDVTDRRVGSTPA